jgi:hypothetical protein
MCLFIRDITQKGGSERSYTLWQKGTFKIFKTVHCIPFIKVNNKYQYIKVNIPLDKLLNRFCFLFWSSIKKLLIWFTITYKSWLSTHYPCIYKLKKHVFWVISNGQVSYKSAWQKNSLYYVMGGWMNYNSQMNITSNKVFHFSLHGQNT